MIHESIAKLLYYRNHTKSNSTSSKILQLLYPDRKLTIKEIADQLDSKHLYIKRIVFDLHLLKYITHDKKSYSRSYSLTQIGRWFAICNKLEISFLSLCLLSDMYYSIKKHPDDPFYLVSSFRILYDSTYKKNSSAIYSKRNIFKSIQCLVEKNLAQKICKDVLKLESMHNLQNYDKDILALHDWVYHTSIECDSVFFENYTIDSKQQRIFSLIK